MSDTSSGSPRSSAKSSAKPGRAGTNKPRPAGAKKTGRGKAAPEGVLANLPRTRPQRPSARRDAARHATASAAATTPALPRKPRAATAAKTSPSPAPKPAATKKAPAKARPKPKPKPKAKAKAKATAKHVHDPAPRQGFETEGDPVSGPVQPPGSVDLLSSAAELAGELTKSGLASGGRLLKDFLTRLPLN
ncbi:MAG TPA: hypothetical protein VGL54_09310 [Solirubrobacteraceae bacterium]|jgi:hypothetical protein